MEKRKTNINVFFKQRRYEKLMERTHDTNMRNERSFVGKSFPWQQSKSGHTYNTNCTYYKYMHSCKMHTTTHTKCDSTAPRAFYNNSSSYYYCWGEQHSFCTHECYILICTHFAIFHIFYDSLRIFMSSF